MRASSIKYLVLFGLIGAWVAHKQKRLERGLGPAGATAAADDETSPSLASLVKETPAAPYQKTATAVNPFPADNPMLVPTGAAPGG